MKNRIITADADGIIKSAAGEGWGFLLEPAGDAPGSFPATIRKNRTAADEHTCAGPRALYFAAPFSELEVRDVPPLSTWSLSVTEHPKEVIGNASGKSRRTRRVQAATAIGTAAPASATDGIAVFPGYRVWQFLFSGTSQAIELWIRTVGGTWRLAETIDLTAVGGAPEIRSVYFGGGRVAFRCAGVGTSVEIDVESEVG